MWEKYLFKFKFASSACLCYLSRAEVNPLLGYRGKGQGLGLPGLVAASVLRWKSIPSGQVLGSWFGCSKSPLAAARISFRKLRIRTLKPPGCGVSSVSSAGRLLPRSVPPRPVPRSDSCLDYCEQTAIPLGGDRPPRGGGSCGLWCESGFEDERRQRSPYPYIDRCMSRSEKLI